MEGGGWLAAHFISEYSRRAVVALKLIYGESYKIPDRRNRKAFEEYKQKCNELYLIDHPRMQTNRP